MKRLIPVAMVALLSQAAFSQRVGTVPTVRAQGTCEAVFETMEITQAVQTWPVNTIPLISLRPTTVRVYLRPEPADCTISNVQGELFYNIPGGAGRFIGQADNQSITVAPESFSGQRRNTQSKTLNYTFVAPLTPNLASTVLSVQFRIGHHIGSTWTPPTSLTLSRAQNSLRIGGVKLDVNDVVATTERARPGNADRMIWGVWPFPQTAGPTINFLRPGKPSSYELMAAPEPGFAADFLPAPPYEIAEAKESANAILNKLKWWKILLEVDYLYGFVHEAVSISPGWAWTFNEPSPVGFGTQQEIRFQRSFAHEMGHFFDLGHQESFTDEVGWDVGVPDGRLRRGLGNLKGIAKNDVRNTGATTDQTWIGTNSYLTAMTYILTPRPTNTFLQTIVLGVNDTLTGFDGQPVPLSRTGQPLTSGTQGAGEIRVLDGQGGQLFVTRFDAPTIDSSSGYFAGDSVIEVPYSTSAQSIELRHNGTLQATRTRSDHAPSVVVNSPTAGDVLGSNLTVAWQATDLDGDSLLADIRYSKDGLEWKPLAFRSTASSITVSTDALASSTNATIRISVSDGFNVTEVNVCGLRLLTNRPPQVEIEGPITNTHYFSGSNVILSAQTDDLEDRALPDSSLSWHSDLSGSAALGHGALLEMTNLAIGTHLIECRATDSGGITTSAFVTIVIDP